MLSSLVYAVSILAAARSVAAQGVVTQSLYGRCGGLDWDGPTACPTNAKCYNDGNPWYSQCVLKNDPDKPGAGSPAPIPTIKPTKPGTGPTVITITKTVTQTSSKKTSSAPRTSIVTKTVTQVVPPQPTKPGQSFVTLTLTYVPDDPIDNGGKKGEFPATTIRAGQS